MSAAAQQILILIAQTLFVSAIILLLYRLRARLGLLPLAVFVGSNQYLQTILSATHYIRFGDDFLVSPGSAVLFPAALFTVLLIYHQEGVPRARALILGIVIANVTLTLLSVLTSLQIRAGEVANLLEVPGAIFQVNPRLFLIGTLILMLDAVAIAVIYELLVSRLRWFPSLIRFPLVLALVLIFDSFAFTASMFFDHSAAQQILISQLLSKPTAGVLYGLVLFAYVRRFDPHVHSHGDGVGTSLWAILTYRERYEILRQQKKAQEKAFEQERTETRRALNVAESRYRKLFETMSDGLLVVDGEDGKIIDLNSAFVELSGFDPGELIGRSLSEANLFDAKTLGGLMPALSAEWETYLRRRDLEPLQVDLQLTRFAEGGGRTLVLAVRDITARKTAEQAAHQREVNRLKDHFIATVSHELRTPLASIYGSLNLVDGGKMGDLPAKAERYVSVALRNARRLRWLINDILDFQKIESGMMTLDLEPQDLGVIARQALEDNQGFAERYSVSLAPLSEDHTYEAMVDRRWLLQALTNLLSNAVKHSPEGETVTLSLKPYEEVIRIAVRDRGPGIPESFRDQIFQPFSQAQLRSKPEEGSTGLGLSIAKALIEKMNGILGFTTREGHGTTFYFDLPRYRSRLGGAERDPAIGKATTDRGAAADEEPP